MLILPQYSSKIDLKSCSCILFFVQPMTKKKEKIVD